MSWYKYRFKDGEEVFCPALKKNVKVIHCNYSPIWIGSLKQYDHSHDFWRDNWKGSGYSSFDAVEDKTWPYHFGDLEQARMENFAADYNGEFYMIIRDGNSYYELSKNGYLKTKNDFINLIDRSLARSLQWDKKKPFITKISSQLNNNQKKNSVYSKT